MVKQLFLFMVLAVLGLSLKSDTIPKSNLSIKVAKNLTPKLKKEYQAKGLTWGNEVYLRVFKKENQLEMWVKKGGKFSLFKTYKVCYYSGGLGTKTKQGDGKSPEGFYFVKPAQLNPFSKYHLAFNIGYPNAYERQKGYTGSALMVHGECVSIGCYAMGNKNIEEIYTVLASALEHKQPFARIHIFPFRFTNKIMNDSQVKRLKMYSFWKNLREGYTIFQDKKIPPNVTAKGGKYVFN